MAQVRWKENQLDAMHMYIRQAWRPHAYTTEAGGGIVRFTYSFFSFLFFKLEGGTLVSTVA